MLRQVWKPVATSVAVGGAGYYYYAYTRQSFEIPVRIVGENGQREMSKKTIQLLSMQEVNERLIQNASTETACRPYGITWHHTTASLSSNNPIEDANSQQIIQRDQTDKAGPGDYLFFSVFDGHRGPETSTLLSRTLIRAVALELSQLAADAKTPLSAPSIMQNVTSMLWPGSKPTPTTGSGSDPQNVSLAIEKAFTALDWHLLNAPLTLLKEAIQNQPSKDQVPDLSKHPMAMKTMLPAISGSCALMAIFDTAHRDLYVACAGDSRAVAGIWQPGNDGKGAWVVDVLSEDQTGRNPNEAKRIISEHPKDEAEYVIKNGRILGGLEPSRAFGDARYKWPAEIQDILNQVFMVGNGMPMRKAPITLKTPPYVTARPVVTHRKLSFEDPSSIRFVVIATDGLWDELRSEEVVGLVGGHLAGLKGSIPKRDLPSLVPTTTANAGIDGKMNKKADDSGTWAFVDDNVSSHLIRNALGGGDELALRKIMSIPAPYSRRHRDDITVTVIWWEKGQEEQANSASMSLEAVKSKL